MSSNKIKRGFTIVELLIVVAIIGVLSAVGIPRFAQMLERSREGATKGNISAIRSAIFIYYADREGRWPTNLRAPFQLVYLRSIPPSRATPLANSTRVRNVTGVPTVRGTGWAYCTAPTLQQGNVWCNSRATDSKGRSFTTY